MDYTKIREQLKPRLKDYVESVTSRSKGRNMYVCPLCHSGEGPHATGAFSIDSRDPTRWKCFSCGESGDIFDLIGAVESIAEPLAQLQRAGELFGIDMAGTAGRPDKACKEVAQKQDRKEQEANMNIHTYTYTQTDTDKREPFTAYYLECQKHLEETDYLIRRGISLKTARAYGLGYDSHYTKSTGGAVWKAIIIPTGPYSYVARNTAQIVGDKDRYRKAGTATPLNIKALETATQPIFITEGELDALSIIEVGGEAISLGSTANINSFIKRLKTQKPIQPLVLAFDNDEAGRRATEELAGKLEELGISYYRLDPYSGHKDANEALTKDREAFTQAIGQAKLMEEEAVNAEKEAYLQTSAHSHLQEFIDGIKDSVNTPAQPTGFKKLDEVLDGGLYEGLYLIGGITSLGKTTLALQIADQIAQSGKDVLIFSLEMARTELMSKSISRHTIMLGDKRTAKTNRGITAGARYASYSQEELALIQRAITAYGNYAQHIYIHEGIGNIGTDFIRETVEKHQRFTGQAPVVVIDYVQIIAPNDVRATDKQNTDKAVLELKRISRDFKTPVIGISSFNRASYTEEVRLEAFKESGALEYGSDVLIGLQLAGAGRTGFNSTEEKQKDPREVELVVLKNRNGRTGDKIDLKYYPLFNYFTEA